jgi:hypothetical protein
LRDWSSDVCSSDLVFNITEKGRTLLGMADGILEHTTDAEKLIMYLDK